MSLVSRGTTTLGRAAAVGGSFTNLYTSVRVESSRGHKIHGTKPNQTGFPLLIFCLAHLSRYMPCLCVSPPSGFSSPTLRRPHLSSPPAYRICCLLTLVHLQSARFPRRCPESGKNSTASGLSLKPINANAICSLGHRRRPNPLSYCCIGGNLCR